MKFKIFLFVFIISGINLYSQSFNGGLIFGGSATQITGDSLGGYNKLGIDMGGYINLNISRNFDLQMELKFIQKGSRSRLGIGDTTKENRVLYRLRLNYIEMPFVLKYNLKGLSKRTSDSTYRLLNRLSVEAGIAYAALLSSSEVDLTYSSSLNDNPFKKYELSSVFGLYFKLNENMKISFRRTGSLFAVRKPLSDPNAAQQRGMGIYQRLYMGQYNDVVELTLHYQFNKANK